MSVDALANTMGLGPALVPLARSWPVSMPEMDSLSAGMLGLSLAPVAVLAWGAIGARRALDFYVLIVFYMVAAFMTVTVTNLVFFYFAWEILGLCCWGLGRWGTSLVGRPGVPANAAVAFGSLCMFGALAILAWDSRSLDLAGLQTDSPALVQRLIIAACFLKVWGTLGHAWRAVDGRAFAISQAVLASGGVVVVGIYPIARFYLLAVDWPVSWQPVAMWVGGLVGVVMMVATLGEARMRPARQGSLAASETSTALYRAMTYLSFGFFGWSVALMGLLGSPLEPSWLLWVSVGSLSLGGLFLSSELMGVNAGGGEDHDGGGRVALWPRLVGGVGFIVAGAALIGVPPLAGYSVRVLTALQLFAPSHHLLALGFTVSSLAAFLYLCRLPVVVRSIGHASLVRWPAPLTFTLLLDLGALAWLSFTPYLPLQLLTNILGPGT